MTLATSLLSRLSPAAVEPAPAIDRGDTRFVPPRREDSPDDAENLRGWGFADSRFEISPRGHVVLTGKRYGISGVELPDLLPWMARTMGVPMRADDVHVPNDRTAVPPPRPTDGFRAAIRPHLGDDQITDDDALRLRHGHGHTQEEIYKVLYGTLPRVPDLVVYPPADEQVADRVRAALAHHVVLIPYGGGTNVTDALRCPPDDQKRVVARIAARHGGMDAGGENGSKGYQLTFGIAYIRDLIFRHWLIAESFETSVPWSRAIELFQRVQRRAEIEHKKRGLPGRPFFTGRITQVYETGVCCYFYYGFFHKGIDDPTRTYLDMEEAVRDEILAAGGSLSHHHGVGKLRQKFLARIQSPAALDCVARMKRALDPTDVFGAGNQGLHAAMKGGAA